MAATVSDNTSYSLMGKYKAGLATIYAGYERIQLTNPSFPLSTGSADIGGYVLSSLTQNAYADNKVQDVYWIGLKYLVTPKFNLTGTYYGWGQNSCSGNGCTNATLASCSGTFDVVAGA